MKKRFNPIIDRFENVKILVLGDFLLDDFVFGEISRVSREAPVLILKYQETRTLPGGGANTVANVASLGATPIPLGYIGDDQEADLLLATWPDRVQKSYVFREPQFRTTRKARILAGSFHSFRQQVVRVDYEYPCRLGQRHEGKILQAFSELIPVVQAVIVSDYSLGNMAPSLWKCVLKLARRHQKVVVVDSRDNAAAFRGATSLTPNISEIEAALGKKIGSGPLLEEVGMRLRQEWELEALLVTRGKMGMSLFEESKVTHIPVFGSDEVADVTGAGDTVIATYTTALAAGAEFEEAALLANRAGGIVVMKRGTATVNGAELRGSLEKFDGIAG
ncbi:MAG: bifunctional heptose 7-phosphate kinase/heptose 1-phosphate adenyltransferase [Acidobacteriota bacterium]